MHKFVYEGPVKAFDTCVAQCWKGETTAVSEAKAKCNLAYRYKKQHNLSADTKISLPGPIRAIN